MLLFLGGVLLQLEKHIVVYDSDCGLCRNLAAWGQRQAKSTFAFTAWQELDKTFSKEELKRLNIAPSGPPQALIVVTSREMTLQGSDAWSFLLAESPQFGKFSWIATRLGLQKPIATMLNHGGGFLRRLCSRC